MEWENGHPGLAGIGDSELQKELDYRKQQREKEEYEKLIKNSVMIICPACKGSGAIKEIDQQSGYDYSSSCRLCKNTGVITAQKVWVERN